MPNIIGTLFIAGDANNVPSTDIIVQAFDVDLLNKQLLGDVVFRAPFANSTIPFEIRYTERQFRRAEGFGSADVQVEAATIDQLFSAQSAITFNAPETLSRIQLTMRPVENPASEFERLVSGLTPLMEGINAADLTTDNIRFLARDSAERTTHITAWHNAAMLTRETSLPLEAGYGWFRRLGRPHTLDGLLAQDDALLRRLLVSTIGGNIIPDISDQINDILAQLRLLQTNVVFGRLTFDPPQRITTDIIVQAFDQEFRSETLLGEQHLVGPFQQSASYRIRYTSEQVRPHEGHTADLIIRARAADGRFAAESAVVFNALAEQQIDLTLRLATDATPTPSDTPRRSELEQLQTDLEPLRQGIAYAAFSDADRLFLAHELLRQPDATAELDILQIRLAFLRDAAQFAAQIPIPLTAFYGWFRQDLPVELEQLLNIPTTRLQAALETAIADAIIPNIATAIPLILEAVRSARLSQGITTAHTLLGQLRDAVTERVLSNVLVDVIDLDAEADVQESGTLSADDQGIITIPFELTAAQQARRLQLTLRNDARTLATVELTASADQADVLPILVTIDLSAEEQTTLGALASPSLTARLRTQGVVSIDDLLSRPDLTDDEPDELTELRNRAKLTVLHADLSTDQQTYLLNNNLASPQAIALWSRADFVASHHEGLGGDTAAYTLYKASQDAVKLMQHQLAGNWLELVAADDDEDDDPDIPTGVRETLRNMSNNCGCEDCTSAVGPAAYLAYLLDWMLTHVKDGDTDIPFAELAADLHQPFGALPATCEATTQSVRQVRLAIESLWRFNGRLDQSDLQLPTPLRTAYRALRNQLYKAILTQLGVSFEQLRRVVLMADGGSLTAEQVAAQRLAVANLLGVDTSALSELFFNVDHPGINPSEALLEETFGYASTRHDPPLAQRVRPTLISRQREQLETRWRTEDWSIDAYQGTARLPYIDPAVIDDRYLRTPLNDNPAFALLAARRSALATHREAMVAATSADANGLDTLLTTELLQPIDQLQSWFTILQNESASSAITATHAALNTLNLTPAGFLHLMETRQQLLSGESLGATDESVAAVWDTLFDILSRAFRLGQSADWVAEEEVEAIVFGPRLFWPALTPASVNAWLTSQSERDAWLDALAHRSTQPLIDPDQIPHGWVLTLFVTPSAETTPAEQQSSGSFALGIDSFAVEAPLDAYALWEERRAFIDERIAALQAARQAGNASLDNLSRMLLASDTGLTLEVLVTLREQESAGQLITPRLDQLTLPLGGYRYLAEIHMRAEAAATISADSWDAVEAILVQVEKQRLFAEWQAAERRVNITLHPQQFEILSPVETAATHARSEWLHDAQSLNRWVNTLNARKQQFNGLDAALSTAVSAAESQILPQLRTLLISDSPAPGDNIADKAAWLDQRLLIDMRMDGCQTTTRVGQAIETLQRLVRGIYNQEHIEPLAHLTLDAVEDYQSEWPVIGTYATWRAYMLAYLFPENLLHLSPTPQPSHGFNQLTRKLGSRLTEQQACQLAADYSDYFRDVCHLEAQSSCQIKSTQPHTDTCTPVSTRMVSLTHVFARSAESGRVYWAYLDSDAYQSDSISTWIPLGEFGRVDFILGATPHQSANGKQWLLLFAGTNQHILMRRYDIGEGRWRGVIKLDWPSGFENGIQNGTVIQKRADIATIASIGDFPTLVTATLNTGATYVCQLNAVATGWVREGWVPLYGPELFDRIDVRRIAQVGALNYIVLADLDNQLHYQIRRGVAEFDRPNVHYTWRKLANGPARGVVADPIREDQLYCFYTRHGSTRYRHVQFNFPVSNPAQFERISFEDIVDFNENWLIPNVGISLDDVTLFEFNRFSTEFFIPNFIDEREIFVVKNDQGLSLFERLNPFVTREHNGAAIRVSLNDWHGDPSYSGSLLGLVTRELSDFSSTIILPPDAMFRFSEQFDQFFDDEHEYFYLFQQKYQGVQAFIQSLRRIERASYFHPTLGWWKLADAWIQQLTPDQLTLVQVIEQLLINQLHQEFARFAPPETTKQQITFYASSIVDDEVSRYRTLSARDITIPQHAGDVRIDDDSSILDSRKIIISQETRRGFGVPMRRVIHFDFQRMTLSDRARLAPYGDEALDLLPVTEIAALQRKRDGIRAMMRRLREAPPSVQRYLHEAYLHLPIQLGYLLQQSGAFEQALVWYRQVFDYLQRGRRRKIYTYLRFEESFARQYSDAAAYLNDPSNVHTIATTRRNSYTRHVLLLIVRCLIDYADALFARDNAADNARARELYTLALDQLDSRALRTRRSNCQAILDTLTIDVGSSQTLPWEQFQLLLAHIPDTNALEDTIETIRTIADDSAANTIDRLSRIRETLRAASAEASQPKTFETLHIDAQATRQTLENQLFSHRASRQQLQQAQRKQKQVHLTTLVQLGQAAESPTWLRLRQHETDTSADSITTSVDLRPRTRFDSIAALNQAQPLHAISSAALRLFALQPSVTFDFCIPQNPTISVLRQRAENNLSKLRSCRNIAGFLREVDPYGSPVGLSAGVAPLFSGVVDAPPTPYRYAALIARAKELVNIAQQIESGYQSALESAERETFSVLQAQQHVELAGARIVLHDLRLDQAHSQLVLAEAQKNSAAFREQTYATWLAAGNNRYELAQLNAYKLAGSWRQEANRAQTAAALASLVERAIGEHRAVFRTFSQGIVRRGLQQAAVAAQAGATIVAADATSNAIAQDTRATTAGLEASYERRNEQWQFQQGLASLDTQIGEQQIVLTQDGIAIAAQERAIAELEQAHAAAILDFLVNKTFSEEMYRWIAATLAEVYRYFLQQATSLARLAERQLAFERQQRALRLLQADYWHESADATQNSTDRLGLTGSARLIKDIYRLDQYAFDTYQRKQRLSLTLDLAEMFPLAFQQFRETGVMVFETSQDLIGRQFPGYYLCLIQQVTVSIVALVSPNNSICGSLISAGVSQTVVRGDSFQTITLRQFPERLALTSPTTSSSQIAEQGLEAQLLQHPFEGSGFATQWELRLPKACNTFDYNTLATVLLTIDLSALHNFEYEQHVLRQLGRTVSANRSFRFRHEFADAWYDLHNPDQTATPMTVRFETQRNDFPAHLDQLRLQHVVLYVVREDGETFELPIQHLHFTEQDSAGYIGGGAQTVHGVVSTRQGNGTSWRPMLGQRPMGQWELAFSDSAQATPVGTPSARDLFSNGRIEDILLVLTYEGHLASSL